MRQTTDTPHKNAVSCAVQDLSYTAFLFFTRRFSGTQAPGDAAEEKKQILHLQKLHKVGQGYAPENKKGDLAMNEIETKKHNPKMLLIGLVLLICAAGLSWSLWSSLQQQKEMEKQLEMYRTMQMEPEEEPEGIIKEVTPVITSDTVSERLNSLSELVAKEYLYTNADQFENNLEVNGFHIPFTTKSFTLAYDGRITASVDLSQAQVAVDEDSRKITITLPASKIMTNEIFEDSVRVFNEKDNLFNKITIDNYNEFVVEQKKIMEAKAIEMGVLTGADEEARTMVQSFLSMIPGMTGEDAYTLEIK